MKWRGDLRKMDKSIDLDMLQLMALSRLSLLLRGRKEEGQLTSIKKVLYLLEGCALIDLSTLLLSHAS